MLHQQESEHDSASVEDDRRDSARLRADQHIAYYAGYEPARTQERCMAKIIDESKSGVALQVSTISDLEVGDILPVVYRCANLEGKIKYIQPVAEGEWRLGVEWL